MTIARQLADDLSALTSPCGVQENALVLANNPGRVPFIVDPANACTAWLQSFLAKVGWHTGGVAEPI